MPPIIEPRNEDLIPFCDVNIYQGGVRIQTLTTDRVNESYEFKDFLGISKATVKLAGSMAEIDIEVPLSEQFVQQADDFKGMLYESLNLNNEWEIIYGWGAGRLDEYRSKISNMRLLDFSLSYETTIRGYTLSLKLVPTYKLLLGDINIRMCTGFVEYMERWGSKSNIKNASFDTNPFSLSGIISRLLEDCGDVIREKDEAVETRIDPIGERDTETGYDPDRSIEERLDFLNRVVVAMNPSTGEYEEVDPLDVVIPLRQDEAPVITNAYFMSERLRDAEVEDLPQEEDFKVCILGTNQADCDRKAESFRQDTISNFRTFNKVYDEDKRGISVYSFISNLLMDNGYLMFQTPGVINDKTGAMEFLIIPATFASTGGGTGWEVEYEGIRTLRQISVFDRKIRTFGGGKDNPFDVHSRRNVLLSVDASTDNSQPSQASIEAKIAFAFPEGNPNGENQSHLASMYALLVAQSKSVNAMVVGQPKIKPFSTIVFTMMGKLFSGYYKVMSITHEIGDSFTSSVEMIQSVAGKSGEGEGVVELSPTADDNPEEVATPLEGPITTPGMGWSRGR